LIQRALGVAAFVLITLAMLETALQLAPRLIPPALLQQFAPEPRREIAEARGLRTRASSRSITRDDGGPPLYLPLPGTVDKSETPDAGMSTGMHRDEDGFCNPVPSSGVPVGGARPPVDLLTVGDSFTYCTTVRAEETWTVALATRLGVSARNLGTTGKGPMEYLQVLHSFGLSRPPRVVVFAYYGGNDVRDMLEVLAFRALLERPTEEAAASRSEPGGLILATLDRYSRVYNLTRALVRMRYAPAQNLELAHLAGADKSSLDFGYEIRLGDTRVEMNPENADVSELLSALAFARGAIALDLLIEPLERLSALGREHDFVPIVAYIPSAHVVYAEWVHFDDPALASSLAAFDEAQRVFLAKHVAALGMRFVDTTPALRASARAARVRDLFYFPTNLHLSPAGHSAVADALEPALRDELGP